MVRPVGASKFKDFVVLFATSFTNRNPSVLSSIGRSGRHSLYDVLSTCFPFASRDHNPRNGVSSCEMNKTLQKNGFSVCRSRITGPGGNERVYRFGNCRWYNPDDPEEFDMIWQGWNRLCQVIPPAVGFDGLLEVIRGARKHDDSFTFSRNLYTNDGNQADCNLLPSHILRKDCWASSTDSQRKSAASTPAGHGQEFEAEFELDIGGCREDTFVEADASLLGAASGKATSAIIEDHERMLQRNTLTTARELQRKSEAATIKHWHQPLLLTPSVPLLGADPFSVEIGQIPDVTEDELKVLMPTMLWDTLSKGLRT